MKKCNKCLNVKLASCFSVRKNGYIVGRCKACRAGDEVYRRRQKGLGPPKRKDPSAISKECTKCFLIKNLSYFAIDGFSCDNRSAACKACRALSAKRYRKENKESVASTESRRDRVKRNKKQRDYMLRPESRKRMRDYCRERYSNDPVFIATHRVHSLLARALKATGNKKTGKAYGVLGYSPSDLIKHLEDLFTEGMGWSNRGEWHIDHIKPIAQFIKEGVSDPAIINALNNLQPLWAKDNLSKGAKWVE